MDFHVATVEGFALVSGLEWRALHGTGSADKEIRAYAAEVEAKLYVQAGGLKAGKAPKAPKKPKAPKAPKAAKKVKGKAVKVAEVVPEVVEPISLENTVMCGFMPEIKAADAPKKVYSLPVVLSGYPDISPDCVFILEEGDKATVAALVDGLPAAGFDGQGEVYMMRKAVEDFILMSPKTIAVYGTSETLNATPLTLTELVEKSKTLKTALLHKIAIRPIFKAIGVGLLFLALAAGGKAAFDYKDNLEKMAKARMANANPDVAYENNVTPLFAAAIPVRPAMTALKAMLKPLSVAEGGWNMSSINCNKEGCSFVWLNATGTNKSFVVPGEVKNLKYSPNGEQVGYDLPYLKPLPVGIAISNALSAEQVLRDVVGDFQEYGQMGVVRNFGPAELYGMPSGLMGTPAKPYKEGAYSVSGPWYLLDVISKLPQASTFESVEIAIDAEHHITFKISGKYYVQ